MALHCPVRTFRLSIRVVGSTKGGIEMDKQRLGDGEIVGGVDLALKGLKGERFGQTPVTGED